MIAVGAIVFATILTTAAVYFLTYGSRRPANQRGRGGSGGALRSGRLGPARSPAGLTSVAGGPQSSFGGLPAIRPASEKAGRAERRRDPLPPEALVTFADERRAAAVDDVFAALDRELVGLVPVKKQVEEIGSLLLVDRVRRRFGLVAPRPNLHMCFTGAPGTGKTTVGLLMADLLHQLGYLEQGQLVHAMRDDLVGEFVGQTAPKTRRVCERAMGGVLFIDEASAPPAIPHRPPPAANPPNLAGLYQQAAGRRPGT